MYSDIFCKVYNELGWNVYPEVFGELLLQWLEQNRITPKTALDLGCGTGILCRILHARGIAAAGMDLSRGMIAIARENCPGIPFEVGNMITYRPETQFDLVTCTGDALNHIPDPADVARILRNVYSYTRPGGYFIFDILRESEVSDSEPFEMDFTDRIRVRFQMIRPSHREVNLQVRVYEDGRLLLSETIREYLHDPNLIYSLAEEAGFRVLRQSDRLMEESPGRGTTWFFVARKPLPSTINDTTPEI